LYIKLIVVKHAKHLVLMPQVKRGDSSSLRQLINHVSSRTNAIQALILNASMHDLILNHLLLSVLDAEINKDWELRSSRNQDIPSTTEVLEFLEDRSKALEVLQTNQATGTTSPRSTQQDGAKVSQSYRCHLSTQVQCPSCKGPHELYHCDKFHKSQPQQRFDHVKQVRACINCLQHFSSNHRCSRGTCRICGRPHNTLSHVNKQGQATKDKRPTNGSDNSAYARVNPTAEVYSYCSFKGKPTNQVLLATAILEVQNKFNQYVPCRVTLDSAS
jgi:hypothetical protein